MSIKSRFADSSHWIMNSSESLVLLLLMGSGMGAIFFTLLALVFGLNQNWILMVLFTFFSYGAIKKLIQMIKGIKQRGFKDALVGITAREFVWKKDKYGIKVGGKNGNDGCTCDEVCSKTNAGKNKRIRKEIGHIYR